METASAGAQSVAEAVKRVADAAVAEVNKVKEPFKGDFAVTVGGGRFYLVFPRDVRETGTTGFGPSGTVTIGGVQAKTNGWSTTRIDGWIPGDQKPEAEVIVHVDEKTQLRGRLP